jgi:uncharacterized membrane protein YqjE
VNDDGSDAQGRREGGVSGSLSGLAGSIIGLIRSRLELATIEFEEERDTAVELLVLALGCVLLALFALLFASLFIIAVYWDEYRRTAIAGVTLFYVVLAVIVYLRMQRRRRDKPPAFAATLAELGHDVSAMRRDS